MSIKGFSINGVVQRYDYNALDNKPSAGSGITDDIKAALLQLAQKVAYIDADGQTYYQDLYDALNAVGPNSHSITNTLVGCTTSNSATSIADGESYFATITAATGYTLTGATVSITMGGNSVTGVYNNGTISIASVTGDLVISVTATARTLSSISAVFTPGQHVVYTNDTLDSLKDYLVVTATYADSSVETLPSSSYTLSGTLAEGTQTITVSFGGETDTFTVSCVVNGYLYHFEQSLASSGSKDFGFYGVGETVTYDTGHDGTGYSFYNNPKCIEATGYTPPVLSGDFTIAFWAKTAVAKNGQGFSPYKVTGTSTLISSLATASNVKSGWTVYADTVRNSYSAIRLGSWVDSAKISTRLYNSDISKGTNFLATVPSGFDSTTWHHFAWTRKGSTFRFFVDGSVIFTSTITATLAFDDQCALGGWYDRADPSTPSENTSWYDDLFVAEWCKWDSDFNTSTITY